MTTDILITKAGEEPGAKSLKVEVPVERVRDAEEKATAYYAKRARLPGFRAGKAPTGLVKKRFQDAIKESVLRDLIGESWKAAIAQEALKPIADPHVHHLKFEEGSPITFEFHVEVKPDITLTRLAGFSLARKVQPVTDEMVDRQIDEVRKQKAPWVPVEGDKPKPGELVHLGLATIENGEAGEAKPYQIVLGEGQALPAVEEKLMTMQPGETVDTDVRFPDDHPDEARRGQTRSVRITLHEVKRQELPHVDDAFAREVGDFETAADLKKAVREDLEREAGRAADADVRRQLIEQITQANTLVAPRPLVQRFLEAYAQAYSIPSDEFERFANEFLPIAEAQVRRDLVLDHVVEKENLKATEEELDQRIAEVAARRKVDRSEVYASLQKANRLKELERSITEDKIFQHLLAQSTVTNA